MTSDQALTGLGAIVGGGGLSAIMVAAFAFLTEARKGRKPSDRTVSIAVQSGYAEGKWAEIQAGHLGTIAFVMARLVALKEIEAEETIKDRGFHDRLETKIDRLIIDSLRHAPQKPP